MVKHGRDKKRRAGRIGKTKLKVRFFDWRTTRKSLVMPAEPSFCWIPIRIAPGLGMIQIQK